MEELPASLSHHRVHGDDPSSVVRGRVVFAPIKAIWLAGMAAAALVGGAFTVSWAALAVFIVSTGCVLLLGHSLGSHRKLIHDSFQCPKGLEYILVWLGVQVGLSGPIGLLRQHELRDYAQRLPTCHDYLRHGSGFWRDGWWQLCCDLQLESPPSTTIEPRIADDRFYRFLEATWRVQQLAPALLLFAWGGWGFVFWGTCARVTAGVVGHWLIGYFAHNEGAMHYEVRGAAVQGRNIRFTSLLTMGESWHNNHHAYPGSARLGLFPGEWDPGWWVLLLLRQAGLVWKIRLPAEMIVRSEVRALDSIAQAGLPPRPTLAVDVGLRSLLHTCLRARSVAVLGGAFMEGPAANVSESVICRLIGHGVAFHKNPGARRLTIKIGSEQLSGLPALCVSLCAGNLARRTIGLLLIPFASSFEGARSRLRIS